MAVPTSNLHRWYVSISISEIWPRLLRGALEVGTVFILPVLVGLCAGDSATGAAGPGVDTCACIQGVLEEEVG